MSYKSIFFFFFWLYGRAFDFLLKMNARLLVNLLSIKNASGGSIFHFSIPGDILAYLWLDLLQYKQRIHLFKGFVVNNAEGRGQFLSKAATAASSGRQFQKPACLLSWLTLKDPCCSPAPPHKQTADDFIVCPLLSVRRVQGVCEPGGEREHQWHPVRIRFLFDAWTKHCRNRMSAIPIPWKQKTLRENVNAGLFYWYYSFKSIVEFFPAEFLLGSLWNDSLSSVAALASVSHTSTSQRHLPALPLSFSESLSRVSPSLTYSLTVFSLSCSLRKQVEGWAADYSMSRSWEKQTVSNAQVRVLIAFSISNVMISTWLTSAAVYLIPYIVYIHIAYGCVFCAH